jgi:hypothetical protein
MALQTVWHCEPGVGNRLLQSQQLPQLPSGWAMASSQAVNGWWLLSQYQTGATFHACVGNRLSSTAESDVLAES